MFSVSGRQREKNSEQKLELGRTLRRKWVYKLLVKQLKARCYPVDSKISNQKSKRRGERLTKQASGYNVCVRHSAKKEKKTD